MGSKCSYVGCNKDAVVSIPRANQFNCYEHWEINLLRFGCPDMFNKIESPTKKKNTKAMKSDRKEG